MSNLIEQLRSLARFEHADLSIGDEAAQALELAAVVEEERAKRTLLAERRLSVATEALEIVAGKRQCIENLMSNQDVANEALRLIATPPASNDGGDS